MAKMIKKYNDVDSDDHYDVVNGKKYIILGILINNSVV